MEWSFIHFPTAPRFRPRPRHPAKLSGIRANPILAPRAGLPLGNSGTTPKHPKTVGEERKERRCPCCPCIASSYGPLVRHLVSSDAVTPKGGFHGVKRTGTVFTPWPPLERCQVRIHNGPDVRSLRIGRTRLLRRGQAGQASC